VETVFINAKRRLVLACKLSPCFLKNEFGTKASVNGGSYKTLIRRGTPWGAFFFKLGRILAFLMKKRHTRIGQKAILREVVSID